ncbi:hypothetical protein VTK26DRAFT_3361 [Humicola hyalothermophila]
MSQGTASEPLDGGGPAWDLTTPPQSAASGNSSVSASSPSRKHHMEIPSNGSPQPKRRLIAESSNIMNGVALFRHSAPFIQPSKRTEANNGQQQVHPMRNSALVRFFPAGSNDASFPSSPFDLYLGAEQHRGSRSSTGGDDGDKEGAWLNRAQDLDEGQENDAKHDADGTSEEKAIIMCGDRMYSEWTGLWEGVPRKVPGVGALFPEGYLPRFGHPEPWICPVRDCQTIFADAWALGGHFSMGHRACLLNDNLDGTFSVLGKRKTTDPASGRMPPIIVSRHPINPATAPPKATPRRPGRRKRSEMKPQGLDIQGKSFSTTVHESESVKVRYCHSRFSRSPSSDPGDPPTKDTTAQHSISEHSTAEEDGGSYSSDSSDTSMLFPSETATQSLRYGTAFPARVAGRARMVSIRKAARVVTPVIAKRQSSIRRLAAKLGAKAARREVAVYKPSESAVQEEQGPDGKQSGSMNIANGARRSRRLLEQQSRDSTRQQESSKSTLARGSSPSSKLRKKKEKEVSSSSLDPAGPNDNKGQRDPKPEQQQPKATGNAIPPLALKMADWEIAPGRIRVGTRDSAQDIAFSSSYLSRGWAVHVMDGTTFQVAEIPPGGSLVWSAEDGRTRLCSVARGIIRVTLPEKEFPIGPNGMWKVRPGASCTVVNPFYLGAVVHVTTIVEDGDLTRK